VIVIERGMREIRERLACGEVDVKVITSHPQNQ